MLPRITIVTPSFNQGQYLEQTIQSVLSQNYQNLEYIIMDGGSTDNSVEIIKKYENFITYWQSCKDGGQADAINQGFKRATGNIFGWLNSDDMYLPCILEKVKTIFSAEPLNKPKIIFGNSIHLNEENTTVLGTNVVELHALLDLELIDYINQPSSFWNMAAWEKTGELNTEFYYAFDWDWFIRAKRESITFEAIKEFLSIYRIHSAHKTGTGGEKRYEELYRIYRNYRGEDIGTAFYKWIKNNKIKKYIELMRKFGMHKIIDPDKLIWKLYFSNLKFDEFKSIRMSS